MCISDDFLIVLNKLITVLMIIIPVIYLTLILYKKKKLKIGYFLVAIFLFLVTLFIKVGGNKIKLCDNNQIDINLPEEQTELKENKNDDNSNYIGTTPKGYLIEKIEGAYYVDNHLIVNKSYPLDANWIPEDTHIKITNQEICNNCINEDAYNNWIKMRSDATTIGLNIYIASGYRSYDYQGGLYQNYVNRDGVKAADTYSARAGHSEHQSGLAFDLNSVDSSFAATNESKWITENCYLYGFIIRYPKDKAHETGYKYEPWHLRYVGLELAQKLYNQGNWITMESYFDLESKY
ncbi:MAG: M15 family metallopeptidase [Bacilli bacterium]|nr:M15 family metallopeptidase [Bacilli bacterium]